MNFSHIIAYYYIFVNIFPYTGLIFNLNVPILEVNWKMRGRKKREVYT